jgi:predicted dehydrogenase
VKIGIVGFGEAGWIHLRCIEKAGAKVAGIVTRRTKPPERFPRYPSLEAMLPHVDAVTIAAPNSHHATFCLEAVQAGKPVLVEKPLCLWKEELERVESVLARASIPVKVGFRLRWNPALQALRARLRGVKSVACTYHLGIENLGTGKDWFRRKESSGGAFSVLGSHALDTARWLARARGEPLRDLKASAGETTEAADYPLLVSVAGTLPNGIRIAAGADMRGDAPFHLEIAVDAESGTFPDRSLPSPLPEEKDAGEVEFEGLIRDFVRTCEEGRPNREEIREYLQTQRELLEAQALTE